MTSLKLQVKPTAGGEKFIVEVDPDITILEVKSEVAKQCTIPAAEQRLIYKGQILKDDRTVSSYGISNEHVLHLVRGRPQAGAGAAAAAPAASVGSAPPAAAAPANPFGMGGMGLGGMGLGDPQHMQDMARDMMTSPMFQNMLNNPEILRSMVQGNPMIRDLMDRNPELGQLLNDPQVLRQSLQMAANPSLMREAMRNNDRAMSNVESLPGGFDALRRLYENVQVPLMDAAATRPETDPMAAMMQAMMGGAPAAPPAASTAPPSTNTATTRSAPSETPNAAPLPNPWAPPAAAGTPAGGAAGANPFGGLGGLGGMGGMGGMGMMDPAAMSSMLSNPHMQQMMSNLMSNPDFMNSFVNSNPMMRTMLEANPQLREVLSDPAQMQRMMQPENVQAAMAMQQQMRNNPMMRALMGMPAEGGDAAAPMGRFPDLSALSGLLGGGAGGFGAPAAPAPPADPATAYATQIQQLQEMGFFDRDANIRALTQTNGNVHAAVERLLSNM